MEQIHHSLILDCRSFSKCPDLAWCSPPHVINSFYTWKIRTVLFEQHIFCNCICPWKSQHNSHHDTIINTVWPCIILKFVLFSVSQFCYQIVKRNIFNWLQRFRQGIFYTPPHDSGGVLWFHVERPCVCPSVHQSVVRPSVFHFRMITWENVNGFSPNLVCAFIMWRSGLGLLIGKFLQILTALSARDTPIFSFSESNLCKYFEVSGILWRSLQTTENLSSVFEIMPTRDCLVLSQMEA